MLNIPLDPSSSTAMTNSASDRSRYFDFPVTKPHCDSSSGQDVVSGAQSGYSRRTLPQIYLRALDTRRVIWNAMISCESLAMGSDLSTSLGSVARFIYPCRSNVDPSQAHRVLLRPFSRIGWQRAPMTGLAGASNAERCVGNGAAAAAASGFPPAAAGPRSQTLLE